MTTYQRRRGFPITIYPSKTVEDRDGVDTRVPDFDNPVHVRGTEYPQRASRAEVPGQLEINVIRVVVPLVENVDSWSRFEFWDSEWDVVAPPLARKGTVRHVKHMSVDVKERRSGIGDG